MSNKLSENMTENEKKVFDEGKRIAAKKYQERKLAARKLISDYFETPESKRVPEEIKTAILYLSGSGPRLHSAGVVSELRTALENGPLSSVEIFNKFEYGRPTMNNKIRDFIKNGKPEDRIWVAFDEKTKKYSIVGTGPDKPEGWTGYTPVVKEEL